MTPVYLTASPLISFRLSIPIEHSLTFLLCAPAFSSKCRTHHHDVALRSCNLSDRMVQSQRKCDYVSLATRVTRVLQAVPISSQSGTWSSARCGETGSTLFSLWYSGTAKSEERKWRRQQRKKKMKETKGRWEELWRLHVNCTSSGALVNSIPGTCWSAIHMTVPFYLISSSQKNPTP